MNEKYCHNKTYIKAFNLILDLTYKKNDVPINIKDIKYEALIKVPTLMKLNFWKIISEWWDINTEVIWSSKPRIITSKIEIVGLLKINEKSLKKLTDTT